MDVNWDALKKRIARQTYSGLNTGAAVAALQEAMASGTFDWRKSLLELKNEVYDTIMRWDIRCAKGLLEAFPYLVGKTMANKHPTAYLNDKGNWMLQF